MKNKLHVRRKTSKDGEISIACKLTDRSINFGSENSVKVENNCEASSDKYELRVKKKDM